MMRFVIDETSWQFHGLPPAQCFESLDLMLDQLEFALEQGHLACYSDELFNTAVYLDKCFYDLYAPDSPLVFSWEIKERVASIFNMLSKWQDLPLAWPASFEVQIDGSPNVTAPSIAWAHEQSFQNPPSHIACIEFPCSRIPGLHEVIVDAKRAPISFVADDQSYCDFFRWLIAETTKNPDEMKELAPSAFPSLDFVDNAFDGIKHMSKPYRELLTPLIHHLSAMSDHGKRIFSGPRVRVAAEFGALGVNVSDENGNTKGNSVARKERTININGSDVIFWWHTKLEPHTDRIHFYPDRIANDGRLLVGIFCQHLTT